MVEVYFYDEKIFCTNTDSYSDLIEEIRNGYLLSESDLEGMIFQYYDDNGNVERLNEETFDKFVKIKKKIINVICDDTSKLFQDALQNYEKNEGQEEPKKENELSQISINSIQNNLESIQRCCEEEQKLEENLKNEQTIPGLLKEKVQKCEKDLIKSLKEEILKNSEMIYYSNVQKTKVVNTNNSNLNTTEHIGVSCNICGVCPIKGIRFKCLLCPSVDFCENCESTKGEAHGHPLAVLKYPIV